MRITHAIVLALLAGCASWGPQALPGIPLEMDPTIALITPNGGAGHGCPVDGYVLTARHVIYDTLHDRYIRGMTWSDYRGHDGVVTTAYPSPTHDVALLDIEDPPFPYLPRGTVSVGDQVFWFEFDFRTRANALRSRRRLARVMRIVGQQIVLDAVPIGGASGTCLINERGEVVGIVNAQWHTNDGQDVGTAVRLPPKAEEH